MVLLEGVVVVFFSLLMLELLSVLMMPLMQEHFPFLF